MNQLTQPSLFFWTLLMVQGRSESRRLESITQSQRHINTSDRSYICNEDDRDFWTIKTIRHKNERQTHKKKGKESGTSRWIWTSENVTFIYGIRLSKLVRQNGQWKSNNTKFPRRIRFSSFFFSPENDVQCKVSTSLRRPSWSIAGTEYYTHARSDRATRDERLGHHRHHQR